MYTALHLWPQTVSSAGHRAPGLHVVLAHRERRGLRDHARHAILLPLSRHTKGRRRPPCFLSKGSPRETKRACVLEFSGSEPAFVGNLSLHLVGNLSPK